MSRLGRASRPSLRYQDRYAGHTASNRAFQRLPGRGSLIPNKVIAVVMYVNISLTDPYVNKVLTPSDHRVSWLSPQAAQGQPLRQGPDCRLGLVHGMLVRYDHRCRPGDIGKWLTGHGFSTNPEFSRRCTVGPSDMEAPARWRCGCWGICFGGDMRQRLKLAAKCRASRVRGGSPSTRMAHNAATMLKSTHASRVHPRAPARRAA